MSGLLDKIYNYNYFGYYLLIAIVLLLVLFIIILVFGKKDQHKREVEATKKLQQINNENNAFKEENTETPLNIEPNASVLENSNTEVPKVEDVPTMESTTDVLGEIPEPILPTENLGESVLGETTKIETLNSQVLEQPKVETIEPIQEVKPTLDETKEEPFHFETETFDEPLINLDNNLTNETSHIENNNIQLEETPKPIEPVKEAPVFSEVEVPEFNFDEIVKSVEETKQEFDLPHVFENVSEKVEEKTPEINRGPQIFSSVYVPEPKEEVKVTSNPGNDELDFELPVLKKKEEKIEKPVLTDYNLDSLSGEEYNLKR